MSKKLELNEKIVDRAFRAARLSSSPKDHAIYFAINLISKYLEFAQQEKVTGWVNVYDEYIAAYRTKEIAASYSAPDMITTRKICYNPATGKIEDITEQGDE